ncbi:MAG: SPFH domain-containing protein [Bifidobacteriaceae bacterium]|jgi:membrane protease subunit (stomatin/prohibitin family)|nr:SPFH domain-containing protein [Bifidobacteriaceae bacterium]
MGLIRAAAGAIGGTLGDQWLDAIGVPDELVKPDTVLIKGFSLRRDQRSSNRTGTDDVISNGSRIVVPTNASLLLVDGGRVADVSAEPGYYTVDNATQPSVFVGQWGDSLYQAWERFKFGGTTPQQQRAVFIIQREIRDIKFGTRQPIQYFDTFYNAELFLRAFGSFTILVNNPILFFANVYDKSSVRVNFSDIQDQFLSEFMTKLTAAIAQLSGQGVRVSAVQQHQELLSQAMAQLLDADWTQGRGIEIVRVAVESVNYTNESRDLINLRNRGAMLSDPAIQRGYVAGTVADALHEAGANPAGGAGAMLGVGFAGGAAGGLFGGPMVPPAEPTPPMPSSPTQPPPGQPLAPVAPAAGPVPAAGPPAAGPGPASQLPGAAGGPAPTGAPGVAGAAGVAGVAGAAGVAGVAGAAAPAGAPMPPGGPAAAPKFCPNCGRPTGGNRFCGNCGRQLY